MSWTSFLESSEGFIEKQVRRAFQFQTSSHTLTHFENRKEHRWFPIFMSCTVYENFLAEMRSRARELDTISSAACAARVDSDLNISGVWYHDPKYLDKKVLSKLMKLARLPWLFRKLFSSIASTRNISIIIEQTESYVRLTQKFKFFGSSVTHLRYLHIGSFGARCIELR